MIEHGDIRAVFQQRLYSPQLKSYSFPSTGDGPFVKSTHQRAVRVITPQQHRIAASGYLTGVHPIHSSLEEDWEQFVRSSIGIYHDELDTPLPQIGDKLLISR